MLNYFIDTSITDFLLELYNHISNDDAQNSFYSFSCKKLNNKNKLYQAIETYLKDGTVFYSKLLSEHPEIAIKKIGDIKIGENFYFKEKGAYPNGTYNLSFIVYYTKT